MESAHAQVAVMLIEAGADRSRVRPVQYCCPSDLTSWPRFSIQVNLENETPEQVVGVDGQEQKRAREYVISRCGPPT